MSRKPIFSSIPIDWIAGFLLIVSFWVITRPYLGFFHDTIFYLGGILNLNFPEAFGNDLHFVFGSQDRFTLFPYFYQWIVSIFDYEYGTVGLTIVGEMLWLGSLVFLARSFFSERLALFFALSLAILNSVRFTPLGLAEGYLTPRLFAEALTLFAAGFVVRRAFVWPLFCLCGAMVLHPLMALPGFLFWLFFNACFDKRIWLVVPLGIAVVVGASVAGIPPFNELTKTVDPEWFAIQEFRNYFLFESDRYPWKIIPEIIFLVVVVSSSHKWERSLRIAIFSSLAIMLIGRLTNAVGVEVLQNAFILQVQLHRMGWLFAVLGSFGIAFAFLSLLRDRNKLHAEVFAYLIAAFVMFCMSKAIPMMLIASILTLTAAVLLAYGHRYWHLSGLVFRALQYAVFATVLLTTLLILGELFLPHIPRQNNPQYLVSFGLLVLAIAAAGYITLQSILGSVVPARPLRVACGILLIFSALNWDQRSDYQKYIEEREPYDELRAIIEPSTPIYWEGDVLVPWYVLRQESYFSCSQGTGSVFHRDLALVYMERYWAFRDIGPLDFGKGPACPMSDEVFRHVRTRADLVDICVRSPRLRYLALQISAHDDPGTVWRPKFPFRDIRTIDDQVWERHFDAVHIYDCNTLRGVRPSVESGVKRSL